MEENKKINLLRNVRAKVTKIVKYLNTTKTEKFTFEKTDNFAEFLVPVDHALSLVTSTTLTARILGIQQGSIMSIVQQGY